MTARNTARFLLAATALAGIAGCFGVAMTDQNGMTVDAAQASVASMQQAMTAGRISARSSTQLFLDRIERLDRSGPTLRSVIQINPDALTDAQRLDDQRAAGAVRGPLHGITVLLKDNIDTDDRMLTTAGSLALVDSRPSRDAFLVARLRAAGAVILGKTNLSEWANFRGRGAISGWSARGGQTLNPYQLDRNPGGSSSGSAVAVAAGLATVAVGTETVGSIISPASANGVVGIKPTLGLISRSGIIPIAASFDTAGPIARTVTDAAVLLDVLAGCDPDDPAASTCRAHAPFDFAGSLDPGSLRQARIGVLRQFAGFHQGVDVLFEAALARLREQGAILVDPVTIPTQSQIGLPLSMVMPYEFKDGIERYLATRVGEGPRSLEQLIAFNEKESEREMPYFGQTHFLNAQSKGPLGDPAYLDARRRALELAGPSGIDAALRKDRLNAMVAPSRGPAWLTDVINGDAPVGGAVALAPAVAGYPHITVPMGLVHGLPIGLSFVGTAWSDARLIAYAYAFEQATHARVAPRFQTTFAY